MRTIDTVALILVIVGAVNWLLVGLLEFDLVAFIVGEEFGEVNIISRIIYIIVGIAGIYLISLVPRLMGTGREPRSSQS